MTATTGTAKPATASGVRVARRRIINSAFQVFCVAVTGIALIALAAILWSLLSQGIGGLNLDVFIKSTPAPGSQGGLANAIVGSIMMCLLAMVIATVLCAREDSSRNW